MIAFYLFMLIVSLLEPACMLFFGYRWQKNPPARINYSYGYRTKRSMSSERAWKFAHKHCGLAFVKVGYFTGVVSIVVMIVLPFVSIEIIPVSIVGMVVVILQIFSFIVPLVTTERALKRELGF